MIAKKFVSVCSLLLLITSTGCQTVREIASLRRVDFELDRVTGAKLAGVSLERVWGFEDLSPAQYFRITNAITKGDLPLVFVLHLNASNPESNRVPARLLEMDWTLYLNDKKTVTGVFEQSLTLPPGEITDIPVEISLNLYDFFEHNARDLIEIALSISGKGGTPQGIKLEAVPVIDTIVGPLRYPEPITIVSREVG